MPNDIAGRVDINARAVEISDFEPIDATVIGIQSQAVIIAPGSIDDDAGLVGGGVPAAAGIDDECVRDIRQRAQQQIDGHI